MDDIKTGVALVLREQRGGNLLTDHVMSESTAEAIALLDAQFPWLQWAEKRTSGKRENPGPHAAR